MPRIASYLAVAGLLIAVALPKPASADAIAGINAFQAADYATALKELTPAAQTGDADAAFFLGRMYSAGLGVAKDPARAVELFRAAAEKGNAEAQHNLGAALFLGEGAEQDMTEGLKWIVVASSSGFQASQAYITKITPYVTRSLMLEARKRAREWQEGGRDGQTGQAPEAPSVGGQ